MKNTDPQNRILVTRNNGEVFLNNCLEYIKRNRRLILWSLISTLAWGFIAHSYMFLHSSFSHDSLVEFNADVFANDLRIQLGRVFVPMYRFLVRDSITLPWLIGILSLIYISLAVFFTLKLFNVNSIVFTVILSGIYTSNITVIATAATYIHDLDCNMLSLAFAVLSVYLWRKHDKGYLFGIIPLCISIGIYQSYISVAITLIIIYLIVQLLDGERFEKAFIQGVKSIGMIVCACMLYLIVIKIVTSVTDISLASGNYNSIDKVFSLSVYEVIKTTIKGYILTCYKILAVTSAYPKIFIFVVHITMILVTGVIVLWRVFSKTIKIKEKILALILIALIPLSMNIVYPLTGGMSHKIMEFGNWLIYLIVILFAWREFERYKLFKPKLRFWQRVLSVCLVVIVLWGNVQTANAVYLKKDLEQQANISLFTRILYQVEHCEGYVTGETPIVFVGSPEELLDKIPGFEHSSNITGSRSPFVLALSTRERYVAYFDYILLNPAIMADSETWIQMQINGEVAEMPCYPAAGSIAIVDGILVVKFENIH